MRISHKFITGGHILVVVRWQVSKLEVHVYVKA